MNKWNMLVVNEKLSQSMCLAPTPEKIKEYELYKKHFNELYEEIERLNNIINECAEDILKEIQENHHLSCGVALTIRQKLIDYREIKGDGSNEPSFEEMVGFVENVCKDIKSQPTLHEELEEERKTIAKIVGDFKEVNK